MRYLAGALLFAIFAAASCALAWWSTGEVAEGPRAIITGLVGVVVGTLAAIFGQPLFAKWLERGRLAEPAISQLRQAILAWENQRAARTAGHLPPEGERVPQLLQARWNEQPFDIEEIGSRFRDDDVRRQLVIVGEPGSGKSAALYRLRQFLLARAERSPTRRVPVIYELSRWPRPGPVEGGPALVTKWLARETELLTEAAIPSALALRLLDEGQIIPLFDGLDEIEAPGNDEGLAVVARLDCLRAILTQLGGRPFALCCRRAEWDALGRVAEGPNVVEILPISPERALAVLDHPSLPDLAPLADAVRRGDEVACELVTRPLALRVATELAGDASGTVRALVAAPTVEAARDLVWRAYVDRPLNGDTQARGWLSEIARSMQAEREQVFWLHEIERYAARSDLAKAVGFTRMVRSAAAGILAGLAGLVTRMPRGLTRGELIYAAGGCALFAALGLHGEVRRSVQVRRRITWADARRLLSARWRTYLAFGLAGALAGALAFDLFDARSPARGRFLQTSEGSLSR